VEEVFSTTNLEPKKRYSAWQDAICDIYLKVDVRTEEPDDYNGFVREDRFGRITLTDTFLSPQQIARYNRHVAQLDKDCYYIQFIQRGHLNVVQSGTMLVSNAANGALFCASEPYKLLLPTKVRAYYVEVPRDALSERFPGGRIPIVAQISTGIGLGKIAAEFCNAIATSAGPLPDTFRARVGEELIDVLALAVECGPDQIPFDNRTAQHARLHAVKEWIEDKLSDPNLNLEKVARCNQVSLRQLHYLFGLCTTTPADWIWQRRLQRCYETLASDQTGLTVTDIAFQHGFSSSSHFSTLFRKNFGMRPSDVKRSGPLQLAVIKSA
jgi:AraC-like DNA-binding protein